MSEPRAELKPRPVVLAGLNGLRLAGEAVGDPAAAPVLLLHGGGQTRHAWAGTAARLAMAGYHAICYDARGHGDSEWPEDGDYSPDGLTGDLRCIVEGLGRLPVLVGASMGGITSMIAIAETSQPLARALVLVDIAARLERSGVERILNFMLSNPEGFATLDEAAEAIHSYNPHRPRPQNLEGLKKNLRLRADGRWYWHWDPRFLSDVRRNRDVGEALVEEERRVAAARRVRVPTLLVRGVQSDVLTADGARQLCELIPHAESIDIAGAGHMVAGDRNDVFADAVLDFLLRHAPTSLQPAPSS